MKAIIISEADDIIHEFSEYYKSQNYDIIVYRWLMKALDNIDEIDPDLIFINATEYPRHWKILCQYVRGLDKTPKIVLFTSIPFTNEDKEKAECLKVESIVNSSEDLEEVCTLDDIYSTEDKFKTDKNILEPEKSENVDDEPTIQENNTEDEIIQQTNSTEQIEQAIEISEKEEVVKKDTTQPTLSEKKVCKFLFSNPENFILITGKVIDFSCPKFFFIPDNPKDTKNLKENTIIKKCTLKIDEKIHIVDVQLIKNSSTLEFNICK